jgi:hydroxymethylpyrimidine pyrophosphatase-like HAD family hydrolase
VLDWLYKRLHIPLDAVMVFGDNYGDQPMLEKAGHKVLIANAAPEIRVVLQARYADIVMAPPNEEDGVAKIIKKHVLP